MKKMLIAGLCLLLSAGAFAKGGGGGHGHVHGYTKRDGTYVQPHERTAPNSTRADNYSTRGNTNPFTGKEGTKDPYGTN